MKKPVIAVVGVIVALLVLLGISAASSYNSMVSAQADVEAAQSKIDTTLQRRYDLIPNVVATVKGYMEHESQVFTDIANARARIGSASSTDEAKEAQGELDSAISRLLVLTENYPQLKADTQTSALIAELEGTENRIFVARNDYNAVANSYNKSIRRFPRNIWAGIFGFETVDLYEAQQGAENAPKVSFD